MKMPGSRRIKGGKDDRRGEIKDKVNAGRQIKEKQQLWWEMAATKKMRKIKHENT